ncbi:hypothetical protein Golomagni_03939 [Golovinomyces magnicellulatus]|nr:hypothetical protein Golomagni_03939 [Golovinomyces magnicellulatus]
MIRTNLTKTIAKCGTCARKYSKISQSLSLNHVCTLFIQRTKVLSLYRHIIRSSRCILDLAKRREMIQYVRNEFERNREVEDLVRIRYLVSTGKADWERASQFMTK